MSKFKGTPGEWIASESDTYAGAVDVDSYDAAWCVCTCWGDGSDEGKKQAEIHARAIAAVPKMIAALEYIKSVTESEDVYNEAKQALAAALGE